MQWNEYDAYLFDIDGTLINCTDAVHYFAFCEALTSLAGRPLNLDGVSAHGNTDVGILRDALKLAQVGDEQWRPRLPEVRAAMGRFVTERVFDMRVNVLPAVPDFLSKLQAQGAILGVATGNLETIGRLKLRCAGLLEFFAFGGYSDDYEFRKDVFQNALQLAHKLAGSKARVCAVGDTPEDVRAAKANALDVIAVATGIFEFDELAREQPTFCVRSLHDLLQLPHSETIRSN